MKKFIFDKTVCTSLYIHIHSKLIHFLANIDFFLIQTYWTTCKFIYSCKPRDESSSQLSELFDIANHITSIQRNFPICFVWIVYTLKNIPTLMSPIYVFSQLFFNNPVFMFHLLHVQFITKDKCLWWSRVKLSLWP